MATTDDQRQTRFRVQLTAPRGRVISTYRTDSGEEAVQAFAKLAKTDFGKDLGRGANAALVDNEQRLDAAKIAEGHGVYNMRFLREEGRAAYEAVQPSPPGFRYPVDLANTARETTPDRAPEQLLQPPRRPGSPDRTDADSLGSANRPGPSPTVMQNKIAAHRTQPDDDAKTAALRKQLLDGLTTGNTEKQPRRADDDVEWRDGTPFRRTVEPAVTGEAQKAARDVLGRATEAELLAYAAARKQSPEAAQQVLGAARERIEADLEAPPAAQRRTLPSVEDRFNVVQGAGVRSYQFRDQPGKVAFTERWLSMATAMDTAAVVKAMVDRAEERGWTGIRVAGSEEFKRQAWIAAEARGIKAVGYEPTQGDRAASKQEELRLAKERPARSTQHGIETGGTITRQGDRTQAGRAGHAREGHDDVTGHSNGGRAAASYLPVMRELERAMTLKGVPEAQRDRARAAVRAELNALAVRDKAVKVKLYDPAASRQAPRTVSRPQPQRAEPDRAR